MASTEEWRPVVGYEGRYEVSDLGRVRTVKANKCRPAGFVLKAFAGPTGYSVSTLHKRDGGKQKSLHILVAAAFIGERPVGLYINHKDGNKANPRLDNLEYCTPSENSLHAYRTGLSKVFSMKGRKHKSHVKGQGHQSSKLTDAIVIEIRRMRASGVSCEAVAQKYGITNSTVSRVATGKWWGHVKDPSPPPNGFPSTLPYTPSPPQKYPRLRGFVGANALALAPGW